MAQALMCDHCKRVIPDTTAGRRDGFGFMRLPAGWFSLNVYEHGKKDEYENEQTALAGDFCSFRCVAHHAADELDRRTEEES